MKKKDFVSRLMNYGVGFAMSFLIIIGLSVATIIFLALVALVSFFNRLLN